MATFFLDLVNGNDANDGTTFANRWKTFNSGATNARLSPGDVVRVMATPAPTQVGNATWTDNSATVTLASAVTLTITNCESAWTASANITAATTVNRKEGALAALLTPATAFTTGKMAYFTLPGTLDLSAYQQLSCQFQTGLVTGQYQLCLCTDTTGDTVAHTLDIPAGAATTWSPYTKDFGANMNSAIRSVSVYAVTDPGTSAIRIDNIIACKASSSADSLTLNSLIGKEHNLPWAASTAYTTGKVRTPTNANRKGECYVCTTAGTSGSSEPTWPDSPGATVSDGSVVWTYYGVEDGWWAIAAIDGTTVTLDTANITNGNYKGYAGTTETVNTYKRECFMDTNSTATRSILEPGTAASPITFTGGWDTTAMTAQTGETWIDHMNSSNAALTAAANFYIDIDNIHFTRCGGDGFNFASVSNRYRNISSSCSNSGLNIDSSLETADVKGVRVHQSTTGIMVGNATAIARNINMRGCSTGAALSSSSGTGKLTLYNSALDSCTNSYSYSSSPTFIGYNCSHRNSALRSSTISDMTLVNPTGITSIPAQTIGNGGIVRLQKVNGDVTDNRTYYDGGVVSSDASVRHTASGLAWRYNPTLVGCNSRYPMRQNVAQLYCDAGVSKTVSIWTRRDNTNIVGTLTVKGDQLPGVAEQSVVCTPTINTWVQSSTITFTPTESGVIEIEFSVYDGVGTTNSFWVDDLTVV